MKKIFSIFAFMMACLASSADDKVSLHVDNSLTVKSGEQLQIPIQMTNSVDIQGVAFHISLPEGMTFAKANNIYSVDLSDRWPLETNGDKKHLLSIMDVENKSNCIQIAGYGLEKYLGNDGEMFTINIEVDPKLSSGSYEIKVEAISFSEKGSVSHVQDAFIIPLQVKPDFITGDINQDTKVNSADITALIDIMLGKDTSLYNLNAADVNGDGKYNSADITGIIEIMLNQ